MALKIAIPKETSAHETRVAASPETVKKLIDLGARVSIEAGAGGSAESLAYASSCAWRKVWCASGAVV